MHKKIIIMISVIAIVITVPLSAMALNASEVPEDLLDKPRAINSQYKNWILFEYIYTDTVQNKTYDQIFYYCSPSTITFTWKRTYSPLQGFYVRAPYGVRDYRTITLPSGSVSNSPATVSTLENFISSGGASTGSQITKLSILKYSGAIEFLYEDGSKLDPTDYIFPPGGWGDGVESFMKVLKIIYDFISENWIFLIIIASQLFIMFLSHKRRITGE